MKKILFLFLPILVSSCVQEKLFEFNETAIDKDDPVTIQVIYSKINNDSDVSTKINNTIESTLAQQIAFFEEDTEDLSLEDAISQFEDRFVSFKNDFEDNAAPWEVIINSEVVFQSIYVITIAVDSYSFTGGAHGNSVITLLNFDPETGNLYTQDEIFKKSSDLDVLVEKYFKKESASKNNDEVYFFGEDFRLPENVGFNEEGIIFLYNTYEIASYAQGITEFTIPYAEIYNYLNINY